MGDVVNNINSNGTPNAMASAPAEPTQSSPLPNQLQPPQAAPAQAPIQLEESGTPPITATSPNIRTHTFIARAASGLLDAIVGKPGPNYTVDAATGKTIAQAAPPMSTSDKIKRLMNTVGEGLEAGSQVEPRKSGLANALAGMGAGFGAEQGKEKKEDEIKRARAREDFEQQQKAQLHKMEIGRLNALTASTYFANKKLQNEMTPVFGANEGLFNAVKSSPELGGHATEMSDSQVEQLEAKDPNFTQTHIIKPLGWAPEADLTITDEQGNQVPKMFMRMAVIDGTKDGKITITPELADDFKQYGGLARIPNLDTIKAGDSYDLESLIPALAKVEEQKKEVLKGWATSEIATNPDGTLVEINKMLPPGDPNRTRPLTVKPMALDAEEAKSKQERAAAFKENSEGKKALADAALTASLLPSGDKNAIPRYSDAVSKLPPSSQTILRNVPPSQQLALLTVANGDAELNKIFPTRTTKGSGQLDASRATTYVKLLNPEWTGQMYSAKQALAKKMAEDPAIASFNQFFVHAYDAKQASDRLARTNSPWLQKSINEIRTKGAGQPGVPGLMADIMAARNEWLNFIKNGHAADLADTEQSRTIVSDASTPAQINDALKEMGKQAVGRLDQIDARWRRLYGSHYPGLVSNSGREGVEGLGLADMIKDYPVEGGAMFGAQAPNQTNQPNPTNQSNTPPNGTKGVAPGSDGKFYYHDAQGKILGQAPAPQGN